MATTGASAITVVVAAAAAETAQATKAATRAPPMTTATPARIPSRAAHELQDRQHQRGRAAAARPRRWPARRRPRDRVRRYPLRRLELRHDVGGNERLDGRHERVAHPAPDDDDCRPESFEDRARGPRFRGGEGGADVLGRTPSAPGWRRSRGPWRGPRTPARDRGRALPSPPGCARSPPACAPPERRRRRRLSVRPCSSKIISWMARASACWRAVPVRSCCPFASSRASTSAALIEMPSALSPSVPPRYAEVRISATSAADFEPPDHSAQGAGGSNCSRSGRLPRPGSCPSAPAGPGGRRRG